MGEPTSEFNASNFIRNLTHRPGIYRMMGEDGQILYVGKAKNLKNRVSSYFRSTALDIKTLALVSRIRDIEVTVTSS